MNYCKNCGRQISNRSKTCSSVCREAYHRKKMEEDKPPLFTHCQNPDCGKKLNHWVTGKGKTVYMQDRKYCNRQCSAHHKSIYMTGSPSKSKSKMKEERTPVILQSANFGNDVKDIFCISDVVYDIPDDYL